MQLLWIDALSISQSNIMEKIQQVRRMGNTYTNARDTLIWLGPETEDSTVALQRMAELYNSLPLAVQHQVTKNLAVSFTADGALLPGPAAFWQDITTYARVSSGLTSFFNRRWFSRTWAIQEVILSRKPVVMCGNAVAPWTHVAATTAFLSSVTMLRVEDFHPTIVAASHAICIKMTSKWFKNSAFRRNPSLNPLDVVNDAVHFNTTDPRDKIFGLLGLVENAPGIFPNYFLTADENNIKFTRFYLSNAQNYHIWGHHFSFNCSSGLPSWTQTWAALAPGSLSDHRNHNGEGGLYDSNTGSNVKFSFQGSHSPLWLEARLVVTGFIVDELQTVSPEHVTKNHHGWLDLTPMPDLLKDVAEVENQIEVEWRHMFESHYGSETTIGQSF